MKKDDKIDLSHLFVAMEAVAFCVAGIPVLDAVGSWLVNIFGLQSVKLSSEANKITSAMSGGEQENTHVIGFDIGQSVEEEIEDE